jgi:hypothetical protein
MYVRGNVCGIMGVDEFEFRGILQCVVKFIENSSVSCQQ